MVDKTQAEDTGVNISATGIVPEKPGDDSRNSKTHEKDERKIIPVLPFYDWVFREVTHISNTGLAPGFEHHPTNVGEEETLVSIVGVKVCVGIAVVSTMTTRPPLDGTFNGASTEHSKDILEGARSVVGAVSPETMITSSDAETGEIVVEGREQESLPSKRSEDSAHDADKRGNREDGKTEPADVFIPIVPGNRGKRLLGLQGVGNIVVGDVKVSGDIGGHSGRPEKGKSEGGYLNRFGFFGELRLCRMCFPRPMASSFRGLVWPSGLSGLSVSMSLVCGVSVCYLCLYSHHTSRASHHVFGEPKYCHVHLTARYAESQESSLHFF